MLFPQLKNLETNSAELSCVWAELEWRRLLPEANILLFFISPLSLEDNWKNVILGLRVCIGWDWANRETGKEGSPSRNWTGTAQATKMVLGIPERRWYQVLNGDHSGSQAPLVDERQRWQWPPSRPVFDKLNEDRRIGPGKRIKYRSPDLASGQEEPCGGSCCRYSWTSYKSCL